MTDATTHEAVERLFFATVDLDPGAREELLQRAAATQPELVAEVRAFLAAEAEHADFLAAPAEIDALAVEHDPAADPDTMQAPVLPAGARIGPYTIVRRLGVGSTGEVYEVEQERPRRRVALKILRVELVSARMQHRFEHEAEMLARLQHEGIAQVYEVTTQQIGGRPVPCIAMEHVPEARPITDWAQHAKLGRDARLELFAKVCRAVDHAHGRGAIHRDLKPANILVGGDGRPRVIDFGVARVIDPLSSLSADSQEDRLVGTLQYMSPEQCDGDVRASDVRSDIYSLGVVLYELLCGEPPYALSGKSLAEITTIIRERGPQRLGRGFDEDLWTVLRHALAKDPSGRYRSAGALADDLDAVAGRQPIRARPPSMWYLLRLFAARHRGLVALGALSTFLLFAGVATVGWLYLDNLEKLEQLRQAREHDVAQQKVLGDARDELRLLEQRLDRALGQTGPTVNPNALVASIAAAAQDTDAGEDKVVLVGIAVDTLSRLEGDIGDDVHLMRSIAGAYTRVGDIHGTDWYARPEDVRNSARAYDHSLALWRRIVETTAPATWHDRYQLARALVDAAETERKLLERDRSMALAYEAVGLLDRLIPERRNDLPARLCLMSGLFVVGDAGIGRPLAERGEDVSRRAVDVGSQLYREYPDNVLVVTMLAWAHFRRGMWLGHHGLGQAGPAVVQLQQSTELRMRAIELAPERTDLVLMMLGCLGNEIAALEFAERADEVPARIDVYTESIRTRLGQSLAILESFLYWRIEAARRWQVLGSWDRAAVILDDLERLHAELPAATHADPEVIDNRQAIAGLRAAHRDFEGR